MKVVNRQRFDELSPSDKEAYLQKLKKLEKYKEINPLYFHNHPVYSTKAVHVKQMTFHELVMNKLLNKFALFGGNQSGKTTGGGANSWIQAVDFEILPPHLKPFKKFKPPFHCRVFTPDLMDTMHVVQEKLKELAPIQQLEGDSWEKAYSKEERILRLKNGSWFQFMSYEQEVKKVGSATLHRVWFDEEPPLKFFEESLPRLMRYGGDMIFTMTPLEGLSWAFEKIWLASGGTDNLDEWMFVNENKDVKTASIVVDMDDNPYLTQENKEDVLNQYDASTRKARKEGRFVHFAGAIYNEFKEYIHVVDPFECHVSTDVNDLPIPLDNEKPFANTKDVNVIVGIDPGMRYTAVIWAAVDSNNMMYIFDELLAEDWIIKEVCEFIKRANAFHEIDPIFYIIDPQARERSKQTGKSDQSEYARHGIYTVLGQKAWSTGVDQVKQRLRDKKVVVFRNCAGLRKDFPMYRYKENKSNAQEDNTPKPVEKDDHRLDAVRYIIMSRPYLPEEEIVDERTADQKIMDADKEKYNNSTPVSEFGGGIYL